MTIPLIVILFFILVPSWSVAADCISLHEEEEMSKIEWRMLKERDYTLCYHIDYIDDTFIAVDWIENAFRIGLEKYRVVPPVRRRGYDLDITVFLTPVTTRRSAEEVFEGARFMVEEL